MTIKEFFDARADRWDAMTSHDPHKLSAVVTLAGVREGSRVLDIACGTGVLEPELLSRAPASVLAVDVSDRMIAVARGKFSDPRLTFLAADLFSVAEEGFDAAVLYSAYPHFPDRDRLARHVASLLSPGGRITVAHGEGRAAIDARHGGEASEISRGLLPARQEAAYFDALFEIDTLIDSDGLYVISGVKRRDAR